MSNLLRVEFYKFVRNKTFWVLAMIMVALSFLLVLFPYLAENGVFDQVDNLTVEIEIDEQVTESTPISGIKIFLESIHAPELFLAVLLISVLGAFFIANENSNGAIKNLVSIGYHRRKVYLAKMIVFSLGSIILVLFTSLILAIFGALFFEIGDWPSSEVTLNTGKVLFLSCLYLGSFAAIVMFFSIIANGSGIALLLSVGFYLLTGAGLRMLAFNYKFGETLSKYSVYHRYSTLFENDLGLSNVIELATIPLITAIIFIGLSLIIFQRKDIS